jgi:hypothetical protein
MPTTLEQVAELRLPTFQSVPAKLREAYRATAAARGRPSTPPARAALTYIYEPHWLNDGEGPPRGQRGRAAAGVAQLLPVRARCGAVAAGAGRCSTSPLTARLREWTRGDWRRKLWAVRDPQGGDGRTGAQQHAARTSAHDAAVERRPRARKKVSQSAAMRALLMATGLHPDTVPAARAKYPPPNADHDAPPGGLTAGRPGGRGPEGHCREAGRSDRAAGRPDRGT